MNAQRLPSRWRAAAVAAAMLIAVTAAGAARAGESRTTPVAPSLPGRPLDSRLGEAPTVAQLQKRLDALAAAGPGDCVVQYESHKAQAWLNFVKYAGQNAAPAAVTAAALRDAGAVLTVAETGASPSMETFELPGSRHERDDLWRTVIAVKSDGRLCGAPKMTAYCEVQLAWAGYEASKGGWRHVDPYVRIAEDYCTVARDAVAVPLPARVAMRDAVVPVNDLPATPPIAPVEIAPPAAVAVEKIDISVFVLFPHNRSGRGDIRSPGRAELARLAAHLKGLPDDTLITVTGHADVTGNQDYNQKLSARRAQTVAGELRLRGVDPARLQVGAAGSAEPVVACRRARGQADRPHYLACLEPNRRVVIRLVDDYADGAVARRALP
jgi:outer membrane protein OmpA-like peptidoglycan-associated protein